MKKGITIVKANPGVAVVIFALALLAASYWVLPQTASAQGVSPNADLAFDMEDIRFILDQIVIAERHAAGEDLLEILPNASAQLGLRTVDGSFNNVIPGQEDFGQADLEFPTLVGPMYSDAQDLTMAFFPDDPVLGTLTSYTQGASASSGVPQLTVEDSTPRLASHLIVNQSVANPAAVFAAAVNGEASNIGPDIAGIDQLEIPNVAVDEGLSAPTNAFITFFGQFFDHGLDLINKGGNGLVFMPLGPDDPLYDPDLDGPNDIPGDFDDPANFMLLTRATVDAGPDGELGTPDDVVGPINATTPHVDQQQTYASHTSAQILLRHYEFGPCTGQIADSFPGPTTPPGPLATCLQNSGRLLNGFGDNRILDVGDGGMATWDTVQVQAFEKLGFDLDDFDGNNMPMFAGDFYGNFIPGPARGLPQLVCDPSTIIEPCATLGAGGMVEGDLTAPVDASQALRINHSFFLDIAHSANPNGPAGPLAPDVDLVGVDLEPGIPGIQAFNPRTDTISGQLSRGIRANAPAGFYDDELLGVHFACGDGRCNENIALTTIHSIFHHEHNRLSYVAKRVLLDNGNLDELNEWLDTDEGGFPAWGGLPFSVSDATLLNQATAQLAIDALGLDWNGERIFQVARFGTEMQYNRIVFDEFVPTLAGLKDDFEAFHTDVDPSISAEFSQAVYRFGHSMLTHTVDRFDPDFATIVDTGAVGGPNASQYGLFEAFLNPLALYNYDEAMGGSQLTPEQGAGAVIRGITRTRGNEIDEFVTGALQNSVYGLPLDLGAINIARARDVGMPRLNDARRAFFAATQDTRLAPYVHWADYADNLRHEPSLVNFVAAYGTHPSVAGPDGIVGNTDDPAFGSLTGFEDRRLAACAIVGILSPPVPLGPNGIPGDFDDFTPDPAAYCEGNGFGTPPPTPLDALDFMFSRGTWVSGPAGVVTGLDDVDFWNGGIAEERMPFGGYLGSTHNFVFETQAESLQNGDRFYYVGRTANIHLFSELESNSFTALAMRSTDLGEFGAGSLPLNIFSVPNHILEVDQSEQFDGDGTEDPEGDAQLTPLVIRTAADLTTNIHVGDDTRVIQYTGGDHVTIGGTSGDDTIIGGIGDDAIYGREGNDRIEGGDGADLIEGGPGDDIITDLSGPDVIEGGDGNDAINSGNEEDVIFGDDGNDFIVNPSEFGEIFAGLGDDYIFDGVHNGHIRGGAGHDWMENLGGGEDLFQADNGAAPELGEPPVKGNDVAIGHGGNNDFDMENGDDIIVDGPGIERAEGQLGFDWISFQNDIFGVNVDLDLTIFLRPQLPPSNDSVQNRYDRVEAMSGSPLSDILRGTPNRLGEDRGNELLFDEGTGDLINEITGLADLVPVAERRDLLPDVITGEPQFGWTNGEIIVGGAGNDLMVGEAGDDILDGDAALTVMISTPDPAIRTGPLGQALRAAKAAANSAASQADLDADAAAAGTELMAAATAAEAAATAAMIAADAAATAAEAAQAGLSGLTITDAIGNLIAAALPGAGNQPIRDAWQDFLGSCSAALGDLGFDVGATAANSAAEALAEQAAAIAANAATTQAALDATADASALAVPAAQAALAAAQVALDAADVFILVPGMRDVQAAIFGGFINPGELSISRIIADDDPADADTDIALFSGDLADYTCTSSTQLTPVSCDDPAIIASLGFIEVTDTRPLPPNLKPDRPGNDGRDLVRNAERLQFSDQAVVLDTVAPINSPAVGQPTVSSSNPPDFEVNDTATASITSVTDPDNGGGAVTSPVDWTWQVELEPGTNFFTPIERVASGNIGAPEPIEASGPTLVLTGAEFGLQVRVQGIFQDDDLVFETVTSAPFTVTGVAPPINSTLSIRFATWRTVPERLRVAGDTTGSTLGFVSLFAPGTVNGTGDGCTGTLIAAPPIDIDLEFLFDSGAGFAADPVEVCVSMEGTIDTLPVTLAVSALTVLDTDTPPTCGDGFLEAPEECDDGNLVDGDGCSAICEIEPGPVCGNGTVEAPEECDDGNVVDGDGCSAICEIEPTPVCGNGTVEAPEECDDGNLVNGDGCSDICEIEPTGGTVTISLAVYRESKAKLRVQGMVTPIGSTASLYAPGTTADGITCTGTFVQDLEVNAESGNFSFKSDNGAFPTDPVTVCVSSDNGAAASAPTS